MGEFCGLSALVGKPRRNGISPCLLQGGSSTVGTAHLADGIFHQAGSCVRSLQYELEFGHDKRQTMSILKCHKSHVGRARSNSSLHAALGLMTAPGGRQVNEKSVHLEETISVPKNKRRTWGQKEKLTWNYGLHKSGC